MKKNFSGAVVLLIAVALFLSTAVTAETVKERSETLNEKARIKTINTNPSDPIIEPALGPVIFSQLPHNPNDPWNGFLSDFNYNMLAADDYVGVTEEICDVHWWGFSLRWTGSNWVDCDSTGMKFEIIFWNDVPNPVCVYSNFIPTVESTGLYFDGKELFYWSYDIEPCCPQYPSGWVSIQSYSSPNNCAFFWITSPTGNWNAQQNWVNIGENLAFELTGECTPSIDVEKYVWDPKTTMWVDADTESTAQGIVIDSNAEFKIVIHNDGECPLYNIGVLDTMLDGLTYISTDPDFDDMTYDPPYWHFVWAFPGPLMPCNTIEIYITASVQGPEGSVNFNSVEVVGFSEHGTSAIDDDFCYVMSNKKSRSINMPFLNWLQSHPNMFPILRLLLSQRLGL